MMVRSSDPATSIDAALAAPGMARNCYAGILAALKKHGPLGAEQVADSLGLHAYQVRKRLPEMERFGLAKVSDLPCRLTRFRREERIWQSCQP